MTLSEWGPWIGAVFAAVGGGAGIMALIKARPEAKKIDAEAAKVIQETSAEMVKSIRESVREDMAALRSRVAELEREREDRRRRDDTQERRLRIHERWDLDMAEQIRRLGGHVPDPPPLYPDPKAA